MDTTGYDEEMYVNRTPTLVIGDFRSKLLERVGLQRGLTLDQLQRIVLIDDNGKIKWLTEDED